MKTLFLVNPHGGGGSALKVFENEIKKQLELSQIEYEIILTERAGHAYQIASALDISVFNALVCVSGDGMLHEVVNGIMNRQDSDLVCEHIKIGIIAGGTGNGVYLSLGFETNNYVNVVNSIKNDITSTFDILKTTYLNDNTIKYAMLSVSIGFVSDHDLLTEKKLRWMGPMVSSSIAPVYTWLKQKEYRATVSFIPFSQSDSLIPVNGDIQKEGDVIKVKSKFFILLGSNLSRIAANAMIAPEAKTNDGCIHLVLSHSAGYYDSFWMLLGMENGTHINHSSVEIIKVKSFTVELDPLEHDQNSFLSIDGELFPIQPFKVDVIPSKIKMFSPQISGNQK